MRTEQLYFIGSQIMVTLISPKLFSQPMCTANPFWMNISH